jgi:hypothetical protein
MWYLFIQIWAWLLAAFALGWIAHWLLTRHSGDEERSDKNDNSLGLLAGLASGGTQISENWRPHGFVESPDMVDDLKRIKGVGAVIEDTLNSLGIYQFAQISQWNPDNVTWIEDFLTFPGRIEREGWIVQAATLESGGTTEFASRVDNGELEYD